MFFIFFSFVPLLNEIMMSMNKKIVSSCLVDCWLYIGYSRPSCLIIYYLVSRSMLFKTKLKTLLSLHQNEWFRARPDDVPQTAMANKRKTKNLNYINITHHLLNQTNWFSGIMVVVKKFYLKSDAIDPYIIFHTISSYFVMLGKTQIRIKYPIWT